MQAGGFPIAVSVSYNQEVFPNLKRLLCIRIFRPLMMALMAVMPLKRGWVWRKSEIVERGVWSVSILVYIETASAIKKEDHWA
jgi:hypothetical protein